MATSQYSILAASDDPKIRDMIRAASGNEGFETILCGDGDEALESARKPKSVGLPLKLIVLEAFLPKVDGHEVLKQLEESAHTREIPSLMLINPKEKLGKSAPHAPSPAIKIRLNADDYLQKPFEQNEIRAQIHSMTKHYRAHRAAHPVTGLPGHPELEQEIFSRLFLGETLGLVCMDINHFRPFNDHYGTDKGNEVIRMAVRMIQGVVKSLNLGAKDPSFLSHVDGDDFVLLAPHEKAKEIRQKLRQQFQTDVQIFYTEEEGKQGYYHQKDREEKDRIFPLMSLSTAVLDITREKYFHYGEIVSDANELLRQSKVGSQDVL